MKKIITYEYEVGDKVLVQFDPMSLSSEDKEYLCPEVLECMGKTMEIVKVVTFLKNKLLYVLDTKTMGIAPNKYYFVGSMLKPIGDGAITNGEKIRSMSNTELSHFLISILNKGNTFGEEYEGEMSCLEWLNSSD